jgi:RsiW-degrading membrane proteinase PrsW (M82 family)
MANQFCVNCGTALSGGRFCSNCGTPVAATAGAPAGSAQVFEKRTWAQSNIARKAVDEMKLIGFGNLLPYRNWLADKPWNLLWVRCFLGIGLFPLLLSFWASTAQITFESIAFVFGTYFALMWAGVLYFMLNPRLAFSRILQISVFTIVVGIFLVLTLQQLPIESTLYSETNSASILGKLTGFVLGVGIMEESAKVLPIWWLYIHAKNEDNLSTIVFLGCISGFAFGVAEAARYSISYALGLQNGNMGMGTYLITQMTRLITLPLLHAVWCGIFSYFVALASVNRHVGKGLLLAGLIICATLHGTYDTFSDSIIGVGIAVLSMLIFVAYYRSGVDLQAKISSLLVSQPAKASTTAG